MEGREFRRFSGRVLKSILVFRIFLLVVGFFTVVFGVLVWFVSLFSGFVLNS